MNRSVIHLLDLPDEILVHILSKLNNIDVLYSLFDIKNERLDSITRQKIYSNILNFASIIDKTPIIDRFCMDILPRISSNIKRLIVEPASMERILLASHYPNLNELKICNFRPKSFLHNLTGRKTFVLIKNSIAFQFRQSIVSIYFQRTGDKT